MSGNDLVKHFFGGFIRMHLLYHAAKAPIWGVEMMEELARHGYRLGPGTLYPILHQLEASGYLTSETGTVQGRRRKYYRITKAGNRLLASARTQLRELVAEVLDDHDRLAEAKARTSKDTRGNE